MLKNLFHKMPHMLKNVLSEILTPEETAKTYSAFDMIGDIIIIKVPDCLRLKKEMIANVILKNVKQAKSVFAQTSPVHGDYRIRKLEFLAGKNSTVTVHKEHGCRFKIDVAKTYFSPRLSTERLRIADMISDNEVITNMFAGIGTYSIIIANMNKTCKVYSIDSNPVAIELCKINAKLNKVQDRVIPIYGDAKEVINKQIKCQSNRVLMPLPEKAREFVDSAIWALKENRGTVHYFAHIKAYTKKLSQVYGAVDTMDAFKNYKHEILSTRVIREIGPRIYQIVSDVSISQ
jgi:tRNA (guanine37-N1)-methyltransferase